MRPTAHTEEEVRRYLKSKTHFRLGAKLTDLNLNWKQIGDGGVAILVRALEGNTTLKVLGLYANQISDEGAGRLADALTTNTALQYLALNANRISDEGAGRLADALTTNTVLQKLWLDVNRITNKGAAQLAQALTANTVLQRLDLHGNPIKYDGAHALSIALASNPVLERLDLPKDIDEAALAEMASTAYTGKVVNDIGASWYKCTRTPAGSELFRTRKPRGLLALQCLTVMLIWRWRDSALSVLPLEMIDMVLRHLCDQTARECRAGPWNYGDVVRSAVGHWPMREVQEELGIPVAREEQEQGEGEGVVRRVSGGRKVGKKRGREGPTTRSLTKQIREGPVTRSLTKRIRKGPVTRSCRRGRQGGRE